MASALVAQMSCQNRRRARGEPRRVGEAGTREVDAITDRAADRVDEGAGRQLREVAQIRQQPIVLLGAHHLRHRAEPAHERLKAREVTAFAAGCIAASAPSGGPSNRIAAGERQAAFARHPPSGWPADERQRGRAARPPPRQSPRFVLPTSVTSTSASSATANSRSTAAFCRTGAASTTRSAPRSTSTESPSASKATSSRAPRERRPWSRRRDAQARPRASRR